MTSIEQFHPQYTIIFFVVIALLLILDLAVFNRKTHSISMKESLSWTAFWVSIAMGFNLFVYKGLGAEHGILFLTAYLVELSLSVDNLFVFLLIFSSFKVPPQYQHRVLFWGIIGALALRAFCILIGVEALARFAWLTYVFGAILIYGGIKSLFKGDVEEDPAQGRAAQLIKKIIPVSSKYDGKNFFTRIEGKLTATPLFLALVIVELSDVMFAVDSIPAVLAITQDPFIVYSSNVFAILGLRSIYFALSHLVRIFHYLQYAMSFILIFIGFKIMISHIFKMPVGWTLGIIVGTLVFACAASLLTSASRESSS